MTTSSVVSALLSTPETLPLTTNSTPLQCDVQRSTCNMTNCTQEIGGVSIAFPIIMFLAGIVGNVLALVVLRRSKTEIRSMMFYTLVAALTWNDLIGILLTSPVPLASYINGIRMPAVDELCRFHGFAMVCFGLSTPLIVCTMAVERSLALKYSYFYSQFCTTGYARILVGALWAFVLLFGALPLFGFGHFSLQYPCTWCFLDFRSSVPTDKAYAYAYAILNLAVVVVMTLCNALVMTTLCQVRRVRRKSSNAGVNSTFLQQQADSGTLADAPVGTLEEKNGGETGGGGRSCHYPRGPAQQVLQLQSRRHNRDVELQMICLVCAITTIFAVCWVPLMAYILYSMHAEANQWFGLVAVRLASLNQTINPWIYVILRKSLLARLRKVCCTRCQEYPEPLFYPRKPQLLHNFKQPATQHPDASAALKAAYKGPGQGRGHHYHYVHVGHQLRPCSQFVGQRSGSESGLKNNEEEEGGRGSDGGSCLHPHHHHPHHPQQKRGKRSTRGEGSCSQSSGALCTCDNKEKCKYRWESSGGGGACCRCSSSCSRIGGVVRSGTAVSDGGGSFLADDEEPLNRPSTSSSSKGACSSCRAQHTHGSGVSMNACHTHSPRSITDSCRGCSQGSCPKCDSGTLTLKKPLRPRSSNSSSGNSRKHRSEAGAVMVLCEDLACSEGLHQPPQLLCYSRSVSEGEGDADGAYVDFFLRPRPGSAFHTPRSSSSDVTQEGRGGTTSSCTTAVASQTLGSGSSSGNTVPNNLHQDEAECGGTEEDASGSVSEADDRDYVSKVSTDSSRMSTPDNRHMAAGGLALPAAATATSDSASETTIAADWEDAAGATGSGRQKQIEGKIVSMNTVFSRSLSDIKAHAS